MIHGGWRHRYRRQIDGAEVYLSINFCLILIATHDADFIGLGVVLQWSAACYRAVFPREVDAFLALQAKQVATQAAFQVVASHVDILCE